MLDEVVAFGENGIKTVEDLADCATDDLVGWTERKKPGVTYSFEAPGSDHAFDRASAFSGADSPFTPPSPLRT